MLQRIGVDVLWTHLFPLLSVEDLKNLYNTHPAFRPIIEKYKCWDEEYKRLFDCDLVVPLKPTGFRKVVMRLEAVPYIWGPFSAKVLGGEPVDYVMKGLLNEVYSPNAIDTEALGPIRQFVSDRGILCMDNRVAKYSNALDGDLGDSDSGFESDGDQEYGSIINSAKKGRWKFEPGWPSEISRLYTSDFDIYALNNGSLFHQLPTGNITINSFEGDVLAVEFSYARVFLLIEGIGLVFGWAEMHPGTYTTLIPEEIFPKPFKGFCVVQEQAYALLSKDNEVYIYTPPPHGNGRMLHIQFPAKVKSIHSFAHMCDMIDDGEGIWRCWTRTGLARLATSGFLALCEDGRVYYYTREKGVMGRHVPGLMNIVKIVVKHTAFFALDSEGDLFFVGSTELLAPGVGMEAPETLIVDAYEVLGPDMRPDILKVWQHPRHVFAEGRDVYLPENKIYMVLPTRIPFKGPVLDVNISGRQVNALVMNFGR